MLADQLVDALDLEFRDEWYKVDPGSKSIQLFAIHNPSSTGESDLGNHKLRAKFGHSRTHNEQIVVRPCGIIVARATMVGAEAVSNVLVCAFF
jgi:hypothetical protein